MKNIAPKIIVSTLGVLFSTLVTATCLPVQGTVQTQAINANEQIGNITMTSSKPLAFRKAFGQFIITGGIKGTITAQNLSTGTTHLDHEIGFPGLGSIISYNDVAQVTSVVAEGIYNVSETAPITKTDNSGAFAGWEGELLATGTLDFNTGTNTFTYSGEICRDDIQRSTRDH